MAHIRPFAGIRYARRSDLELSRLIAPPFDVLDPAAKAALVAKHPNNIVNIDLPHMPPKAAGPAKVYEEANVTLQAWLEAGILIQEPCADYYPYSQTFEHRGRSFHRRGFFALVQLSPFGQGQVVPHEKTYPGAIEDRLALMRATRAQLSPVFGLYSDARNEVASALYHHAAKPEESATLDGVRHDLWSVSDGSVENQVTDLLKQRPVYIADGHHRYTTALEYQRVATEAHGSPLPSQHPANFCMFVLVAMQDDGLLIQPTHRLIGGLNGFDIETFRKAVAGRIQMVEISGSPAVYADDVLPTRPPHTMALYDGATRKLFELQLQDPDILATLEPGQSQAWRRLDVAILQRWLLDEIIAPRFAAGGQPAKGFASDAAQALAQTDGLKYQIALLLQPTPLHALEDLGRVNEVMPQKSTYFYPKLATGMMINPLS